MSHSVRATGLIGLALLFAACSPGATATVSVAPTATVAASTVAYLDEACGGTQSSPCKAGTYQSRAFKPTFTVTVTAGWRPGRLLRTFVGADETAAGIPLTQAPGELIFTVPTSLDPPAPGDLGSKVPADLAAWLAANKNFVLGGPTAVTIGGLAGVQLDGIVAANAKIDPQDQAYRLSDYLLFRVGQHVRFAVVTVGGAQVVLATVAGAADWDTFVKAADQTIGTLAWKA
jgi:hypothetical protein